MGENELLEDLLACDPCKLIPVSREPDQQSVLTILASSS
jgi:hypothetical protein